LRHDLLAQQQLAQQQMLDIQVRLAQRRAHQERLQVLADQERQRQAIEVLHRQHEAEAERERQELEMRHHQQVLEQESATQQRREQEQRHLDELYQEYGPQSAEQHAEDQARNQDNGPNNPNDEPPHNDPVPPNEPNVPVPQPPPPPPPPPRRQPLFPGGRPYREPIAKNNLGAMGVECQHCHALHFDCEKLSKSTQNNIVFGMCCLEGLVQLPPLPRWPVTLRNLFRDHHFHEHI